MDDGRLAADELLREGDFDGWRLLRVSRPYGQDPGGKRESDDDRTPRSAAHRRRRIYHDLRPIGTLWWLHSPRR
jgi:hypothetical protein